MAENSKIEWTDATWNPITGCSVVSPGCQHCYAMKLAGTRMRHHHSREGLTIDTKAGPVWNGAVRFNEQWLADPLRWRRPRMIFVCAHGDLFHEKVPDEWIDRVFAVMALAPQHTFQVLTKRAERMRAYLSGNDMAARIAPVGARLVEDGDNAFSALRWQQWPLPNVWLGVSAEDQQRADERVPHLLQTPAAVRWLSAEPLLGSIDLTSIKWVNKRGGDEDWDALSLHGAPADDGGVLDWVVAGGESGPGARPMHPDWARSLRDQCATAGAPFFFKQWGEWAPDEGPPVAGRDRIMDGAARCAWWGGDGWHYEDSGYHIDLDAAAKSGEWVYRLGKKAAGRLLDGVQHDAMPEVGQ